MRQIQRVTNLRRQAPLPPAKPPYKTAHGWLKLKPFGAKQASSPKAHRRSRSQNLARKDALAGASGDIKFNEPNRAKASALG